MSKLNINQWAEEDRPREKMMQKGAEALTDAELLAILIGSGNTEESAVSLMQRVLAEAGNNLHRLGKWQVRDFARFKGLGPAKSISIMAALELGKRRTLQERPERPAVRSSRDIYEPRPRASSTRCASAAAAWTRPRRTCAPSCVRLSWRAPPSWPWCTTILRATRLPARTTPA